MANTTTNFSFNKPLVNDATDEDLWGGYLNDNWDSIDGILPIPAASKYGALVVQSTDDASYEILSGQGTAGYLLKSGGDDALPSFYDASASTTAAGLIEQLTDAEFNTGTDSSRAVLVSNFVKSIAADGYITLPGGLIIQWGEYTDDDDNPTVSLNTSFSSAAYSVLAVTEQVGACIAVSSTSTTTFTIDMITVNNNTVGSGFRDFFWLAIGK